MGNQQSTRCRPARLVGDRPELNRILPHQMGGGILVRLWLLRGSGLPDFDVLGETNPYVRCRLLAGSTGSATTTWCGGGAGAARSRSRRARQCATT